MPYAPSAFNMCLGTPAECLRRDSVISEVLVHSGEWQDMQCCLYVDDIHIVAKDSSPQSPWEACYDEETIKHIFWDCRFLC